MELEYKDLKIETARNSSKTVSMRITHLPTGASVEGADIRQCRLRKALIEKLTTIVSLLEI